MTGIGCFTGFNSGKGFGLVVNTTKKPTKKNTKKKVKKNKK